MQSIIAGGGQPEIDDRLASLSMMSTFEQYFNAGELKEPWLSAFDPTQLQRQLLELGFSTAESAMPEDLNARYFARRKDGLGTGGGVCIMRASK